MSAQDYSKILKYIVYEALEKQGESEIYAYRINNNLLLTTNCSKSSIYIYIYEKVNNKLVLTILPFNTLEELFDQLVLFDIDKKVIKYFKSKGLTRKKIKLAKTSGTTEYEKR